MRTFTGFKINDSEIKERSLNGISEEEFEVDTEFKRTTFNTAKTYFPEEYTGEYIDILIENTIVPTVEPVNEETVPETAKAVEPVNEETVPETAKAVEPVNEETVPEAAEAVEPVKEETVPETAEAVEPVNEETVPEAAEAVEPVNEETVPETAKAIEPVKEEIVPETAEAVEPVNEETVPETAKVVEPVKEETEISATDEIAVADMAFAPIFSDISVSGNAKPKFRPSPTFAQKMLKTSDIIQERYDELKNYALRFKRLKSRISKKFDSVNQGRLQFVKLSVAGKTLKLYLNMDIATAEPKFHCKDMSGKKTYVTVPVLLRIKSARATRYAKILIDKCAEQHGLVENKKFMEIDAVATVEQFIYNQQGRKK